LAHRCREGGGHPIAYTVSNTVGYGSREAVEPRHKDGIARVQSGKKGRKLPVVALGAAVAFS